MGMIEEDYIEYDDTWHQIGKYNTVTGRDIIFEDDCIKTDEELEEE